MAASVVSDSDHARLELAFMSLAGLLAVGVAGLLVLDIDVFWSAPRSMNDRGVQLAKLTSSSDDVRYKAADLPVWGTTPAGSPLYRGDQVFTEAGGSATLDFSDKTRIEMSEKSLLMVDLKGDEPSVDLVRGG